MTKKETRAPAAKTVRPGGARQKKELARGQGSARRKCVIVLGMHRSGTSALTRILSLSGAALPNKLLGPNPTNEMGHWEPLELVGLHDHLLFEAGSRWDDWRQLELSAVPEKRMAEFRSQFDAVIEAEYAGADFFVLKEPRICRFVPHVQKLLADKEIEPAFAIVYRNPISVAESLCKRDGMTRGFASLLWLRHLLDAEYATRGAQRAFVSYEDLVSDCVKTLETVTRNLDAPWSEITPELAAEMTSFLSSEHQHHLAAKGELEAEGRIADWVKDTFRALELLKNHPDDPDAKSELDRVREEFNHFSRIFGDAAYPEIRAREAKHEEALAQIGHDLKVGKQQFAEKLASATAEIEAHLASEAALEEKLSAARTELTGAKKDLTRTQKNLTHAQEDLTRVRRDLTFAQEDLTRTQKELDDLGENSRSEITELRAEMDREHTRHRVEMENTAAQVAKLNDRILRARIEYDLLKSDHEKQASKLAAEIRELNIKLDDSGADLDETRHELLQARSSIAELRSSTSWRVTAPIRYVKNCFQRLAGAVAKTMGGTGRRV